MAHPVDLVLEGGGVKGIALTGAAARVLDEGHEVRRVAGSSAGAIVGALVAAGLPGNRLASVMRSLDYRKVLDRGRLDPVPILGEALSVLFENGMYEGRYLHEWLTETLSDLGVRTFGDLRYDDPGADATLAPDTRYRLVVTATDLTQGQLLRLPWDYHRFGLDPDRQPVADAVRASMSIPFVFEPVPLRDTLQRRHSTLVDGGVLSNFPIETFDRRDGKPPRWPTFGVKLLPELPAGDARLFPLLGLPRARPVKLLEALIATVLTGHDQTRMADPCVAQRLIAVDTDAVSFLDFGLSRSQQDALYRSGYDAAAAFLAGWDWTAYRSGPCGVRPGAA